MYVEWQTKMIATFLSSLSMSPKGAQALGEQAASLSIYGDPNKKKKSKAPTKDHLPPEDGSPPAQPDPGTSMNGAANKDGSAEKLMMIFGGGGLIGPS